MNRLTARTRTITKSFSLGNRVRKQSDIFLLMTSDGGAFQHPTVQLTVSTSQFQRQRERDDDLRRRHSGEAHGWIADRHESYKNLPVIVMQFSPPSVTEGLEMSQEVADCSGLPGVACE